MHRGELDCSAMMEAPTSLLERYRKVLWETTAYVISKLSHKAAPTEVRSFCSQALATAFFRLPALRIELLKIILPPGESRHKHVREWNLPWSLQKSALREAYDDSSETVVALGKRSSWFTRSSLQACFTRAAASAASVVSDKLSGANASSTTIAVPEDGASGSDRSKSPHVSPRASARACRVLRAAHPLVGYLELLAQTPPSRRLLPPHRRVQLVLSPLVELVLPPWTQSRYQADPRSLWRPTFFTLTNGASCGERGWIQPLWFQSACSQVATGASGFACVDIVSSSSSSTGCSTRRWPWAPSPARQ